MKKIIQQKGKDFSLYSIEEQKTIHNNYKLAIIIRDILNTTILDDKGQLAPNLQSVITAENRKVSEIRGY